MGGCEDLLDRRAVGWIGRRVIERHSREAGRWCQGVVVRGVVLGEPKHGTDGRDEVRRRGGRGGLGEGERVGSGSEPTGEGDAGETELAGVLKGGLEHGTEFP
jgi:hypothetical protein